MGMNNFTSNNNDQNGGGIGGFPGNPLGASGGIYSSQDEEYDISDLVINYNDKFQLAEKALFRDKVIQQTISCLIGKNKPNALLIGPAGVGKTKIVEDIARRIACDDPLIPDQLKGYTIYELPLSNVVAGSSFVGQLEEKVKAVIAFMSDPKNKAILFIDEIHQIVGESQTYDKIAQILKPALARGELKCIGATTSQESQNLFDDPAFNRRFTRLIVDEFSRDETIEILKNARAGFMSHYKNKCAINDDTLTTVAIIADQYKTVGSHRPDNALTLLDRAIADTIIAHKVMMESVKNDPAALAALQAITQIPITEKAIKSTAVKLMTGNRAKDALDIDALNEKLSAIKGQDEPVDKIVKQLVKNDRGLFPRKTPLTMLLAGTSGVGKTQVVKYIAEVMTGMEPISLNMTEYHDPASINRIIGAPAGYVGSDSKSELPFDILESNPYQVILLDEFEKADKSVQRLFMSAFDEGYIKTSKGKVVDFSKAIIFATTNAGHTTKTAVAGFMSPSAKSNASNVSELSKFFDTELLNRFNNILTFNELSEEIYANIVKDIYAKEVARLRQDFPKISVPDEIPDDELEKLVQDTYVPAFGARPARTAVTNWIEENAI